MPVASLSTENPLVLNFLGDSVHTDALAAVSEVYSNSNLVDLYDDLRFVILPRLFKGFLTQDSIDLRRFCSPVACAALAPTVHEGQTLSRDDRLATIKSVDLQGVVNSDVHGPCFVFTCVVHQVHCFYDEDGRVVLGDPGNIHEVKYSIAMLPSPDSVDSPWTVAEVSVMEDRKLLW